MLPQGSSDPALLRTIESLQKDLDQSLRDRKVLESEFDKQIYQEREEKKKLKEDIVAL
jgi:phage regulator Rha-like protein